MRFLQKKYDLSEICKYIIGLVCFDRGFKTLEEGCVVNQKFKNCPKSSETHIFKVSRVPL